MIRRPTAAKWLIDKHYALNLGHSLFWRRFAQGHHRETELLVLGAEKVPHAGPRKGCYGIATNIGRPPR